MGSRNSPNKWKFKINYVAPVQPQKHDKHIHKYMTTSWNAGTPLFMDLCQLVAYIRHISTGLNVTTLIYDVAGTLQMMICRKTGHHDTIFGIKLVAKWCIKCYGRQLDLVVFNYLSPYLMAQSCSYMRPYIRIINNTISLQNQLQSQVQQLNEIIKQKNAIIKLQSELLIKNSIIMIETKQTLMAALSNDIKNEESDDEKYEDTIIDININNSIQLSELLSTHLENQPIYSTHNQMNKNDIISTPSSFIIASDNDIIDYRDNIGMFMVDDDDNKLPQLPNEKYQDLYYHSNIHNKLGNQIQTNYYADTKYPINESIIQCDKLINTGTFNTSLPTVIENTQSDHIVFPFNDSPHGQNDSAHNTKILKKLSKSQRRRSRRKCNKYKQQNNKQNSEKPKFRDTLIKNKADEGKNNKNGIFEFNPSTIWDFKSFDQQ